MTPTKPFVRCPICSSGLIYPLTSTRWARQSVVERRCPECEHRDVVITNRLAAAVWLRRGERAATGLLGLADALAEGLEIAWELQYLERSTTDKEGFDA
jgi:hypothetical protein